jgi:hypothetical protein
MVGTEGGFDLGFMIHTSRRGGRVGGPFRVGRPA